MAQADALGWDNPYLLRVGQPISPSPSVSGEEAITVFSLGTSHLCFSCLSINLEVQGTRQRVLGWFSASKGSFAAMEKGRDTGRVREVVGIAPRAPLTPLPAPQPLWLPGGCCERQQTARLALSPQVLFLLLPPTPPTFLQLLVLLFPPTQPL